MTVYYKMRQILFQNVTSILLQNATDVYYKMRHVFYYKMRRLLQIVTVHNGIWLFSIRCVKGQVACREVRVFQLFNIEVNYIFISTIWITVSIWFAYDLSLNYKFINSVVKVFFACIFKIYRFYLFIINLAQIGVFILFLQIINNRNLQWKLLQ